MSIDIRLPNITGKTEKEQISQMRSYLYQFAEQLQWALKNIETGNTSSNVIVQNQGSSNSAQAKTSPVATFNSLKSLIIKSADIVNAYYDEINTRLEGIYLAQSDFGTYAEETAADIQANSTAIEQHYTNLQQIISDINVRVNEIASNAYIRSGLLDYFEEGENEGAPIYGIEVGQTIELDGVQSFNKFARFTADRLSFYDANEVEVAYVSDYKLVITNAEVKGNLKLGGFVLDSSIGLALRWEGRS